VIESPIKRPFQETEYTQENIAQLIRCKNDPIYFIETFVKVQHPKLGIVPMELYEYQREMIDAIHNNKDTIILASRQLGKCVLADTRINTIERPTGLKKFILKLINRKVYADLFRE
jgi:hypothetical protein